MPRHDGTPNLIPLNKRSKEAQREIQSKGGIAAAKKSRQNSLMAERINAAYNGKVELTEKTKLNLEKIGYDFARDGDPTAMDIMIATITANAMNGDLAAFKMLARYAQIPDIWALLEREKIEAEKEKPTEIRPIIIDERPKDG